MRVLCLTPNRLGYSPGQRGSIELWESILTPAGIDVVFASFETKKLQAILHSPGHHFEKAAEMIRGYVNRAKLLQALDEFDAVFIYREAALLGPALLESLIAKKKPIIYQLDDPLFIPYRSPSNGYMSYLKFFSKIKHIISLAKVVIVNSTQIREYAEQFNKNIWQVPSVVDTDKFRYVPPDSRPARVCIGWTGSSTTLKNISMIERPLREISAQRICDIRLIGGSKFPLEGVDYKAQEWNIETEIDDLRRLHVGLVPLPDRPWNRYKFIMKTAQYMSLGIVPVGTPMSSNTEVIRHGENGFLATTDSEWTEYLKLLISDHELRNRMSAESANDAMSKYSLRANASKVIEAFTSSLSTTAKAATHNGN